MPRITPTLRLVCHVCGWKPESKQTMEDVQRHAVDAHRSQEVVLDLTPFCSCGSEMSLLFTQHIDNVFRDHYRCDRCRNEGFVERRPER